MKAIGFYKFRKFEKNETDLINKKFFAIILLAIGKITDIPFNLSSQDWVQVYTLAKEQALWEFVLQVCKNYTNKIQKLYQTFPKV